MKKYLYFLSIFLLLVCTYNPSALSQDAPKEATQSNRMVWKGKTLVTYTDYIDALYQLTSRQEGQAFMKAYQAINPNAAENVGVMIGFMSEAGRTAVQNFTLVEHPIFGDMRQSETDIASKQIIASLHQLIDGQWLDYVHASQKHRLLHSQLMILEMFLGVLDSQQVIQTMIPNEKNQLVELAKNLKLANEISPFKYQTDGLSERLNYHFDFSDSKVNTEVTIGELLAFIKEPLEKLIALYGQGQKWEAEKFTSLRYYIDLKHRIRTQVLTVFERVIRENPGLSDEDVITLFNELGNQSGRFKDLAIYLDMKLNVKHILPTGESVNPYNVFVDAIRSTLNTVAKEAILAVRPFALSSDAISFTTRHESKEVETSRLGEVAESKERLKFALTRVLKK